MNLHRKEELNFVLESVADYLQKTSLSKQNPIFNLQWTDVKPTEIIGISKELQSALSIIKNQASREEIISESQMSTSQMSSILPFNSPETLDGYGEAVIEFKKWYESWTASFDDSLEDPEFSGVGQILVINFTLFFVSFLEVFD